MTSAAGQNITAVSKILAHNQEVVKKFKTRLLRQAKEQPDESKLIKSYSRSHVWNLKMTDEEEQHIIIQQSDTLKNLSIEVSDPLQKKLRNSQQRPSALENKLTASLITKTVTKQKMSKTMAYYNDWLQQGQGEDEDSDQNLSDVEKEDDPQCRHCEKKQSQCWDHRRRVFTMIKKYQEDDSDEEENPTLSLSIKGDQTLMRGMSKIKQQFARPSQLIKNIAESATQKRWYVISYKRSFFSYWEGLVILLAVYQSFIVPLTFAFDSIDNKFKRRLMPDGNYKVGYFYPFDLSVDLFFCMDIFTQFFITFIDIQSGDEITKPSMIAKNYIKGTFIFDFLSVMPIFFDSTSKIGDGIRYFKLFKLLRLKRLLAVSSSINVDLGIKTYIKIVLWSFYLFIWYHVVACTICTTVKQQKVWVPTLQFMFYSNKEWLDLFDEEKTSVFKLYMVTLYHAAISFALVDISPRTELELLMFAILLLFSAIVNAIIYGEFGILQEIAGAQQLEFENRYDSSISTIKDLARQGRPIQPDLEHDIIKYVRNTHYLMKQQQQMINFIDSLSPTLQVKIQKLLQHENYNQSNFKNACQRIIFDIKRLELSEKQDETSLSSERINKRIRSVSTLRWKSFLEKLTSLSELIFTVPDDRIVKQGTRDLSGMYTIMSGRCQIFIKEYNPDTKQQQNTNLGQLYQGAYFGEIALLCNSFRTATVISENYCTLGKLNLVNCYTLTQNYPSFKKILFSQINFYHDNVQLFIMAALRQIDYLAVAENKTIRLLAYSMKMEKLEENSTLFSPDDTSNCMYIISQGVLELSTIMDKYPNFVLERCIRGTVVNSHNMLYEDKCKIWAHTKEQKLQFFVIDKMRFLNIAKKDDSLMNYLKQQVNSYLTLSKESQLIVDITNIKQTYKTTERTLHGKDAQHVEKINNVLKNIILGQILKNRANKKVPKLQQVLRQAIDKRNKEEQEKRQNAKTKTLEQHMNPDSNHLTFQQQDLIGQNIKAIEKIMKSTKFTVNQMNKKVKTVFRQVSPKFGGKEEDRLTRKTTDLTQHIKKNKSSINQAWWMSEGYQVKPVKQRSSYQHQPGDSEDENEQIKHEKSVLEHLLIQDNNKDESNNLQVPSRNYTTALKQTNEPVQVIPELNSFDHPGERTYTTEDLLLGKENI